MQGLVQMCNTASPGFTLMPVPGRVFTNKLPVPAASRCCSKPAANDTLNFPYQSLVWLVQLA